MIIVDLLEKVSLDEMLENVGLRNRFFESYLNLLNDFSTNNYSDASLLDILNKSVGRFFNCINVSHISTQEKIIYQETFRQFSVSLQTYRRGDRRKKLSHILFPIDEFRKIQTDYEKFYLLTAELINKILEHQSLLDGLELNSFYQPQNSNKDKIRQLINETIDLINGDISLTEKSKKHIIDYLNKALKELDNENVNWSMFMGRIKETIIVLGALGSFVGGIGSLTQAKDKLEETNIIIEQAAINISFDIVNETFNVENIKQIGNTNPVILQLPSGK